MQSALENPIAFPLDRAVAGGRVALQKALEHEPSPAPFAAEVLLLLQGLLVMFEVLLVGEFLATLVARVATFRVA